jgi:DNA repair exonuclease SbcCD ATPase subunit
MGILKREWTLSSIAKENAKAIDTLREQNAALSKIYQEIKEESERLEQELNLCLNIPTQVKQLVQGQKEASALIQEAEQATDDKLARLKKKMQKVASLCQYAITQKHLLERIKAAGQVEQDLTHLTLECSSRRQELVVLNRDIRDLKDKLQKVLSSLSEQDERIRARLQEVNLRLLGDVTLNNPNLQMETK